MKEFVKIAVLALTFIGVTANSAFAVEVKSKKKVDGAPVKVWEKIGDFCAIKDWHPAVAKCVESKDGGVVRRVLTLGDGAVIKERLVNKTAMSYTYVIESPGPLPVANYISTFSITADDDDDDEAKVRWVGFFDAKGASDKDAAKAIQGVYDGGLDAIDDMFDD